MLKLSRSSLYSYPSSLYSISLGAFEIAVIVDIADFVLPLVFSRDSGSN
jgi:hypothetical protein